MTQDTAQDYSSYESDHWRVRLTAFTADRRLICHTMYVSASDHGRGRIDLKAMALDEAKRAVRTRADEDGVRIIGMEIHWSYLTWNPITSSMEVVPRYEKYEYETPSRSNDSIHRRDGFS